MGTWEAYFCGWKTQLVMSEKKLDKDGSPLVHFSFIMSLLTSVYIVIHCILEVTNEILLFIVLINAYCMHP